MTADPNTLLSAGLDSLDDAIADAFAPEDWPDPGKPDDPRHEAFRVNDDRAAEWAARKLAKAHRRIEAVKAMAAEARAAIDAWQEGELGAPTRDYEYFEGLLVDYALRQRAEEDRKSVDLPSATIQTRSQPAKVDVSDDEAYVAWAVSRDGPDQTIKTIRKPLLTEMRKTLEVRDTIRIGDELHAAGDDGSWPDPYTITATGEVVDTTSGEVVEDAAVTREVYWLDADGKLAPVPGTYERPESVSPTVKVKEPGQ